MEGGGGRQAKLPNIEDGTQISAIKPWKTHMATKHQNHKGQMKGQRITLSELGSFKSLFSFSFLILDLVWQYPEDPLSKRSKTLLLSTVSFSSLKS